MCWDIESSVRLDQRSSESTRTEVLKQERAHLAYRRNRRRRELQREVLPRVLCSTPYKDPLRPNLACGVQPCIQFLNVDGSHAVRLFTPPFKPGPIPAPITVFCVAIATEDGCFLSGLKNRFELGHLYPESANDNFIERSPICLCTDLIPPLSQQHSPGRDVRIENYTHDSSSSDDSSCDMSLDAVSGEVGSKCICYFAGVGETNDDDDDDQPVLVYRGHRGPGAWHCYVAVFDGNSSVIRIDGVNEPLNKSKIPPGRYEAFLDGITIGADHTFDMSLCFGQGSDGEGEGAMSELAIFKGRMDMGDIKILEQFLMKKHGIPEVVLSEDDLAQDDEFMRQAHALLSHAPDQQPIGSQEKRIPLRYMARHRLVAWRQSNAVTGEAIKVPRIGSKFGESSSDW